MASLQILKGANEGAMIPLDGDRFIIGRNPDCAICIPVTSASREHAQILRLGGRYFIEDKQSRNGTFVNNQAISGRVPLKNNDKIRICDFLAAFIDAPAARVGDAETASAARAGEDEAADELFRALAEGREEKRVQFRVARDSAVEEECRRLRAALERNHVFLARADATSLPQELCDPSSLALRLLGRGFHRTVVLDVAAGGEPFDLERFLRHAYERMVHAFDLTASPDSFHVENVSQILKDEPRSLFCFLNVQLIPAADLRRLRGFTQEAHQALFLCCGERDLAQEEAAVVEASCGSSMMFATVEVKPEKLRLLLEIGSDLSKTLELRALLPKIPDSLFSVFRQADRCFVIQTDEAGRLLPRVIKTRRPQDEADARFSRSIVKRCLETSQAFLTDDASRDKAGQASQSVADFRVRSVMCVPLCDAGGKAFGVIQLDTQDRSKKFNQEDLKLLWGVASQVAVAMENARLLEDAATNAAVRARLDLALQIQMSFLPRQLPKVAGYDFAAMYQPAQDVGGDYYGFTPLPDGRLATAVGDVSGRGAPAALFASRLSSDARFSLLTEPDPARAVAKLNNLLAEFAQQADRFVTLLLVVLDPARHTLTLVSAGHPSPLLYRPGGGPMAGVFSCHLAGLPLGVLEDVSFGTVQTSLQPGETLVLFSDGVLRQTDREGRAFTVVGARAAVHGAGAAGPQALVERIFMAVQQHAAGKPPFDDITLVAIGRRPA
jgi:serine phosphatase RsbU (regulator of sigma subunit)